jgi:hypothetical protein
MNNAELLDAIVQIEAMRKATASDATKAMYSAHLKTLLDIQARRALMTPPIELNPQPSTPGA